MNINITGRQVTVTPEIRKYCEKRLHAIEKVLGYPAEVSLILSQEKYRQIAEINVKTKGATLNATGETPELTSSLNVVFDHIEKRVKKEREKLREKKRRKVKGKESYSPPLESEEPPKRVIRSSYFSMKPVSIDEAIHHLDAGKKEVFVFRSVDTDRWAVLYRRKDGNYGLVEPE